MTCILCDQPYTLDPQVLAAGKYSPLCTDCLRRRCEAPDAERGPSVPERPIADLN